jgi:uncharacterized membrane protein
MTEQQQTDQVFEGKLFAVISYIGILCIVTLLLKRDNKFALYHGKQGLVLFLGEVACFVLAVIPMLGQIISMLGMIIFTITSIICILQALMGKCNRIPVISEIADKISL